MPYTTLEGNGGGTPEQLAELQRLLNSQNATAGGMSAPDPSVSPPPEPENPEDRMEPYVPKAASGGQRMSMNQPAPISKMDYKELLDRLNANGLDTMQAQKKGIEDAQQYQKDVVNASQPQLDLTPVNSLVDAWTGSNFAKDYKKPMTMEERASLYDKLQNGVQAARQNLTKDQIELLKAQLSSETNRDIKQATLENTAAIRQGNALQHNDAVDAKEQARQENMVKSYQDSLAKDDTYKDGRKALAEVGLLQNFVNDAKKGNPQARKLAALALARSVVNGRLNETEINASGESSVIRDKLAQMIASGENGRMTDENVNYITAVVDSIKNNAENNIARATMGKAKDFSTTARVPLPQALYAVSGGSYKPAKAKAGSLLSPGEASASGGGAKGGAPVVGSVVNGYKFLGGNPAEKSSWQSVGQ